MRCILSLPVDGVGTMCSQRLPTVIHGTQAGTLWRTASILALFLKRALSSNGRHCGVLTARTEVVLAPTVDLEPTVSARPCPRSVGPSPLDIVLGGLGRNRSTSPHLATKLLTHPLSRSQSQWLPTRTAGFSTCPGTSAITSTETCSWWHIRSTCSRTRVLPKLSFLRHKNGGNG